MSIPINRREFFNRAGFSALAGVLLAGCSERDKPPATELPPTQAQSDEWQSVREQFALSPDFIELGALLIASHPKPVREAIDEYRRNLDATPSIYLQEQNRRRQQEVREAAAKYLAVNADEIALTDSTTMGLGLVYNGLRLKRGQEVVTTESDYYATHEALRTTAARTGAAVRYIPLYREVQQTTVDEIVGNLKGAISEATRVVAVTWVHSGTGLKLPIAEISQAIGEINARRRNEASKVLLCVDGVHGFGVEDVTMPELGCDFFIAGCHKWLFGPRGTGIIWGNRQAWNAVRPTIPSFTDNVVWRAWLTGNKPKGPVTASRMQPGGFKPFEHQWAVKEAFEFHEQIGKAKVAGRTHELARRLKDGLAEMPHVLLCTPRADKLSAGIVCFDVKGMSPRSAVRRLRRRGIVATMTPYARVRVRMAPSIRNTPEEIDRALEAVRDLA